MSKLTIVRDALQANPDVLILEVEEKTHLPNPDGFWTHTMNFITAPTVGIYTAEALQAFMLGLVPLEVSSQDNFRSWSGNMEFGKLYFDETIGTDTTIQTIVINDPDVTLPDSYVDGKLTINQGGVASKDLHRRTWVRVYPDQDYARRAIEGDDVYSTALFAPQQRKRRLGLKRWDA